MFHRDATLQMKKPRWEKARWLLVESAVELDGQPQPRGSAPLTDTHQDAGTREEGRAWGAEELIRASVAKAR